MASKPTRKSPSHNSSKSRADAGSWYCAFALVAVLILLTIFRDSSLALLINNDAAAVTVSFRGSKLLDRLCDEIYVVGEGETLHTIGDKCGDPFIVEKNPHIHDPDDVFPGLVIKITPSKLTA
ncbi:Peptidoglycan-binding LysM domain-containing family protein [Quillaja saponaria]|uniref:Peptidoglycan-binding LysM domain-containing family protein n=1 Tax=Quillaja saponaria TaxID=32244 RepID=A0AAD7L495_QUISA|nr:Peptidoglycan-binding LysM domain-containing family protein [Quillaja saponaria]